MHRLLSLVIPLAVFVVSSTVNADDVASSTTTPTDVDRAFAELVQQGDRARFAGNTSDAINAYRKALKIRNDPRIVGRIGLVAIDGGAMTEAMGYLLPAIIDSTNIPRSELQKIQSAFTRTRPLVTRVDIDVSHLGADVFIDGEPERLGTTAGEFYVFTLPGKHEVKATLAGHNNAVVSIDAPKGGTLRVKLVLTPIPTEEPKAEPAPVPVCEPRETKEDWASIEATPKQSARSAHVQDANERTRWIPGFGATILYGAISPYPAGGFVLSSYWTAGLVFSGGFDARVAFSQRGIEGYQIRGGTFTLLPGLCATQYRFTGCLIGHIGGMWHSTISPLPYSTVRVAIGGGASLGLRFGRIGRFDLRAAIYGELLRDEYPIRSGGSLADAVWTGPPYLTGLNITAVLDGAK